MPTPPARSLVIRSGAFGEGAEIPMRHTCEGADASPPLEWSGLPAGAKSLALVVDDPDAPDPDAPKMTWVHWVLYDIPPAATGLRRPSPATMPTTTSISPTFPSRSRQATTPCSTISRMSSPACLGR